MNEETTIIRLASSTPLPCAIWTAERGTQCGKPATVTYAYRLAEPQEGPLAGRWIIQPVCRECAEKAAQVYGVGQCDLAEEYGVILATVLRITR